MSSGESKYSFEHVLGNTSLLRNANPAIRGSIRRADPDGTNAEPHFTGLSGTSLTVDVTPVGNLVINFTSDDLDVALAEINAVSGANLEGFEENGYVVLRNLNGGNKNTLEILSGSAAALLGFTLSPEPGSKSFAGEIATSPSGVQQGQDNPQGTSLISGDEDLKSSSLNRALAGSLLETTRVLKSLDVLVPTAKEFAGSVVVHAGSGKKVVYVVDADLRIPINGYGVTATTPAANELDSVVQIVDANDSPLIKLDEATERHGRVLDVYFEAAGTGSPALDNASSFAAWGTPDGKSIFGPTVSDKDKQAAVTVTSIRGDLIVATGALFQTNGAQPGDTAIVEAADNNTPFNHNGEYIVVDVLSEEVITVRAKSEFEGTFISSDKPRALNNNLPGGTTYGTVRIVVGDYFSAKDGVAFEVPSWVPAGAVVVRCISAARMRDLGLGDLVRSLSPNQGGVLTEIWNHIINGTSGLRHDADQVDAPAVAGSPDSLTLGSVEDQLAELLVHINNVSVGALSYGGGDDWADTAGDTPVGPTDNPATTIEGQLDKMLIDLAGAGIDGVAKISALATADLAAGNLRAQLNELATDWLKLDRANTVTEDQTFDDVTLDVGLNNADPKAALRSTGVPSDRQLMWSAQNAVSASPGWPFIYTRLYRSTEGFELTINARWRGSDWAADDQAKNATKLSLTLTNFNLQYHIPSASPWIDSAWSGDNVLFDLSTFLMTMVGNVDQTGSFDLTGSADITGLLTIGSALLGSLSSASGPRFVVPTAPSARGAGAKTLIMEMGDVDAKWRIYIDRGGTLDAEFFELTYNAEWRDDAGTYKWFREDAGVNSSKFEFVRGRLTFWFKLVSDTSPWLDGVSGAADKWTTESILDFQSDIYLAANSNQLNFATGFLDLDAGTATNPGSGTSVTNRLYGKGIIKAWAKVFLPATTPNLAEALNITSVAYSGDDLRVTLAADMNSADYAIIAMGGQAPVFMSLQADPSAQLSSRFDLTAKDSAGADITLDGAGATQCIWVIVIGEQN